MTALERQKTETRINLTGRKVNKCGRLRTCDLLQVSANVWWDLGVTILGYLRATGVLQALCTEPWRLSANLVADLVLFYCSWKITCRFVFFSLNGIEFIWGHEFYFENYFSLPEQPQHFGTFTILRTLGLWDFAKFAACAERVVFRKGFLWQLTTVEWLEVIRLLRMCN